jgi:hypothetical protein
MKKVYVVILGMFFILGVVFQNAYSKEHNGLMGNPDVFVLHQNYPNPFNPTTILSYDLKTDARVKLIVYNLVGQVIQDLVDEYQPAGFYEISFDANQLPAGVYLYKLQVGEYSSVKRMTLVK